MKRSSGASDATALVQAVKAVKAITIPTAEGRGAPANSLDRAAVILQRAQTAK